MNETEKYLSLMLEGYKASVEQMNNYIKQTQEQLDNALASRTEVLDSIVSLEKLVGTTDEEETDEGE